MDTCFDSSQLPRFKKSNVPVFRKWRVLKGDTVIMNTGPERGEISVVQKVHVGKRKETERKVCIDE